MNNTEKAYIVEQGSGLPDEGDYVVFDDVIYEVKDYIGPIMTDKPQGNYSLAKVERIGDLLGNDHIETHPALVWIVRYVVNTYDMDDMPLDDNVDRSHSTLEKAEKDYRSIREEYHRVTITREAYTSNYDTVIGDTIWDSAIDEVE